MVCGPPGSSVHGILLARILECVAMPSSRDLPNPGIEPASLKAPALAGSLFTTSAKWESVAVFRLYLTTFLFNPLKIRFP